MILYPYPPELDGISIQGDMLYKGLLHNKLETVACDRNAASEKELLYETFKPDAVIGIGYWADTPRIVNGSVDMGSVEVDAGVEPPNAVVSAANVTTADAGVTSHARFGTGSVRLADSAVDLANVRSETYAHDGALPTVAAVTTTPASSSTVRSRTIPAPAETNRSTRRLSRG